MPYLIEDLKEHVPDSSIKYLLDSNIWIKILAPKNKPKNKDRQYLKFFEQIRKTKGSNIILPAMVVSEVMNRLIRDIHMSKFIKRKQIIAPVPDGFYKDVFRPSIEFRTAYALIADDFRIYLNDLSLKNDEFGDVIKYKHVLSHLDFNLDFNDFYYYHLAKKNDYVIVTDDKDFWVKDVRIITLNNHLLNKKSTA